MEGQRGGGAHEHKKGLTNTDLRQCERVRTEAERLWGEVTLPIADGTQTFNAGQVDAVGWAGRYHELTTVAEVKV